MTNTPDNPKNMLNGLCDTADISRRGLIKTLGSFGGAAGMMSLSLGGLSMMSPRSATAALLDEGTPNWDRYVVLVHLVGGNDGLNTLIPYTDKTYYKSRPTLAMPQDNVLKLSDSMGMHPVMETLVDSWKANDLAIVQNLGYPNVNRSHLRSMEIWDTASEADIRLSEGWVGQLFSQVSQQREELALDALGISMREDAMLKARHMRNVRLAGIGDVSQFRYDNSNVVASLPDGDVRSYLMQIYQETQRVTGIFKGVQDVYIPNADDFPPASVGQNLLQAARVIKMGIKVPVIATLHNGFDSHKKQEHEHEVGLSRLAEAMAAFRKALIDMGKWDKVMLMTLSEFGRRVEENGNKGTDHGSAAPHFIMGGKVRGGFYGPDPDLDELDERGDIKFTTHFREYFATAAAWWNLPDSARAATFGEFKPLNCLNL